MTGFESRSAAISASILELVSAIFNIGASIFHMEHFYDVLFTTLWHVALWVLPLYVLHNNSSHKGMFDKIYKSSLFLFWISILLIQPHLDLSNRAPFIGAVHGAASLICVSRALQLFFYPDMFHGWSKWKRMFFMSAWGWHDIRYAKPIQDHQQTMVLFTTQAKRLILFGACCFISSLVVVLNGHVTPIHKLTLEDLDKKHFIRWVFGFLSILFWFELMDAFPCALHILATGHELENICSDPLSARTLKELWSTRWNIPVQRFLANGVYLPITRNLPSFFPFRKSFAKFMVFFVSGICHAYLLVCARQPMFNFYCMTLFFVLQIPLLALEELFKLEGFVWVLISQFILCPLFVDPVLEFIGV